MRHGPHHRMLFGGESFGAVDDGPFAAEFQKVTTILGPTLLANDVFPPSGATIIGVSNFVGGTAALVAGNVQWTQTAIPGAPASFDYTIQDNVNPLLQSTATVTMQGFYPPVVATPDVAGPAEEFTPFLLSKLSLLANDTFGGASPANPVTITILQQDNPPYALLFDSDLPGPWPDIISGPPIGPGQYLFLVPPGINSLEIECYGAEGGAGGDGPGALIGQPGGRGGGRQITNVRTTPGNLLTLAVGSQGGKGVFNPGGGSNFGSGGAAGLGYGNKPPQATGTPDFGFPDGAIGPPAQQGGIGQEWKIPGPDPSSVGAGGGGGAGSAVLDGDITTAPPIPGEILVAAGGGGGGGGRSSLAPPEQGPGRDGGPATAPGTGNDSPTTGTGFFGSRGQNSGLDIPGGNGSSNGRGGSGGGYRGGLADASNGANEAWGGENGDTRVGSLASALRSIFPLNWPRFTRTTTTDLPSTRLGPGRVIIRGRWIQDQLGGQQYPIYGTVVDPNPAWQSNQPDISIQVTSDSYTYLTATPITFYYYLTDTVTGVQSNIAQVDVSTQLTNVQANDDGPYEILENSSNVIVASVANLISNDTFFTSPAFNVESFSGVVTATNNPPGVPFNLRATTGPFGSGSGTITYRITDPNAPVQDGVILGNPPTGTNSTDTAVVTIHATAPSTAGNFSGGSGLEGSNIFIPFATFIANSNGGTTGISFNNVVGGSQVNCSTAVGGGGVTVTLGSAGSCSFRYRMRNGETGPSAPAGRVSPLPGGLVTLTATAPAWITLLNTTTPGNGTSGSIPAIPAGFSQVQIRVDAWGADGGDGGVNTTAPPPSQISGASGGAGGHCRLTALGAPYAQPGFSWNYHVGQPGANGQGSTDPFLGGAGGLGGSGNAPGGFGYTGGGGANGGQGGSGSGSEPRGGGGGGGGGSGVARGGLIYAAAGGGGGGRGGGPSQTLSGGAGGTGGGAPSSNGESGIDFTPSPSTTGLGGGGGGFSGGQTTSSGSGTGGASQIAAEGGDNGTETSGGTITFTQFSVGASTTARVRIQYRYRV